MALTNQEQTKIVQLLGWGGKSLQAGSVIYNKIMNDRLHALPPATEDLVRVYLSRISKLEDAIDGSLGRMGVKKLEDIEFDSDGSSLYRGERKRWARELSDLLDIPFARSSGVSIGTIS